MAQLKIPCMFMRGGTSKGPFFDMRDLPKDAKVRDKILLKVMGSPDARQIDGLGGTDFLTSKVVMVQPSKREGIDVDYLFAQVAIEEPIVDTSPPCGNMMSGVGPFAIERGMAKASDPETRVMIYNINTNSVIEAVVQTPNGLVEYEGDTQISGVPGTSASVVMNLFDQVGGKTGKLFPTGKLRETIDDIEVTCIDVATPVIHINAADLGLSCTESKDYYKNNTKLMQRFEAMRREAGRRMGLGDVSNIVLPKVALLTKATEGGNIKSHYFTPHTFHPAYPVTGSINVSSAALIKGTIASDVANVKGLSKEKITIEHPSGIIEVLIESSGSGLSFNVEKAGIIRTVRKIMDGYVFVPENQILK